MPPSSKPHGWSVAWASISATSSTTKPIYGDGINIAARLEGIVEPAGIFISRQAYDQVDGKVPLSFRRLGPQTLKNIVKTVEVFTVGGIGGPDKAPGPELAKLKQEINCRTPDGARLA